MKEIIHILSGEFYGIFYGIFGCAIDSILMITLFGKKKYSYILPIILGIRFIIYNVGLLLIASHYYGNQHWFRLIMPTVASASTFLVMFLTTFLWKESLAKVLLAFCLCDFGGTAIVYTVPVWGLSKVVNATISVILFLIIYKIITPILKKYRQYRIRHPYICSELLILLILSGWLSNILYNTSASIHENPMYVLGTSLLISVGCGLALAFAIHTRNIFHKKKQLEQNKIQVENYYQNIQHDIKELDDFKITVEGALDELTSLTDNLSQKEKKQKINSYIGKLRTRYQNLDQHFFCEDYLTDGILTEFAAFCKQEGIEADILFQNYHRGNIKQEDSIAILLKLIEYAKQARKVKLHAAAMKNQLVYSMELEEKAAGRKTENEIVIPKKAFKKYVRKYDGEISIEKRERTVRVILGMRR